MFVDLTADQRAFVQKAIESGRFTHEEEAVAEALALWEERERRRLEILAMLDEADASFARGEGIPLTEESVKGLGRGSKAASPPPHRGRAFRDLALMAHRLSPRAQVDIDEIAYNVAKAAVSKPLIVSSNPSTVTFCCWENIRTSDDDATTFVTVCACLRRVGTSSYRVEGNDALIQRVVHGSRDLAALLRNE